MASLYIHIPFCIKKCHYCTFSSCTGTHDLHSKYVEALKIELKELAVRTGHRKFSSLFIGGGTPTALSLDLLSKLLVYCFDLFPRSGEEEITVEANPGTIDAAYLEALLMAGVNRLSLGVQSFNDGELAVIGRLHNSAEACAAIMAAKKAGFTNVNLDLMYGLPGQTSETWRGSLNQAISLRPQHLSLYQLTVEEGTLLHQKILSKMIELPGEEEVLLMDSITDTMCGKAKLLQYEIANYSNPGYQCLHNITYWKNEEYNACGASAVSYVDGLREKRVADPEEYIRLVHEGRSLIMESERLPQEASFKETVIMGLRMTKGVSLQRLANRYQIDVKEYYGEVLEKLITSQLLEISQSFLRLTKKGRQLANLVMAELV